MSGRLPAPSDSAVERDLVSSDKHDEGQPAQSWFTAEQWVVVQSLLSERPRALLLEFEVVEVITPRYWKVACTSSHPDVKVDVGDMFWIVDGSEDIVRKNSAFKEMDLSRELRVGRRGYMVAEKVLWRWHMLLAATR